MESTTATAAAAAFMQNTRESAATEDRLVIPGWGLPEWSALLSYTTALDLDAGEVLIEPKDVDVGLYFVLSGELEVAATSEEAYSIGLLTIISAGSVAGELAFFDRSPRSAKVWAAVRSSLRRLTPGDYDRYAADHLKEAAQFLFAMARLLAIRVRKTTQRL